MHSRFLFPLLLTAFGFPGFSAQAGEPALPGSGYVATRYEALWNKSPFSVASAEEGPSSPDYSLVGIAQFDGISYATVINKQTQGHFLVASDKPNGGFTLISVTRGRDPSGTMAVLQKDGQSMTLKLDLAPIAGGGPLPNMANVPGTGVPMPPGMNGGVPMPNMAPMPGSQFSVQQPPMPFRRRDRIVRIPPPPGQASQGQPGQSNQPGQPLQPPAGQPPGQPNPAPAP